MTSKKPMECMEALFGVMLFFNTEGVVSNVTLTAIKEQVNREYKNCKNIYALHRKWLRRNRVKLLLHFCKVIAEYDIRSGSDDILFKFF